MIALLKALTLTVFAAACPAFARAPAASPISEAIAVAVLEDARNAPVLGSHAEDAALLAELAVEESNVQLAPAPQSWDAASGVSCGPFQERCIDLPKTLLGQARKALFLLHRGREACPESPAAPYLGGCHTGLARRLGDRRVDRARAALSATLLPQTGEGALADARAR
jgi:hypothetical protein